MILLCTVSLVWCTRRLQTILEPKLQTILEYWEISAYWIIIHMLKDAYKALKDGSNLLIYKWKYAHLNESYWKVLTPDIIIFEQRTHSKGHCVQSSLHWNLPHHIIQSIIFFYLSICQKSVHSFQEAWLQNVGLVQNEDNLLVLATCSSEHRSQIFIKICSQVFAVNLVMWNRKMSDFDNVLTI